MKAVQEHCATKGNPANKKVVVKENANHGSNKKSRNSGNGVAKISFFDHVLPRLDLPSLRAMRLQPLPNSRHGDPLGREGQPYKLSSTRFDPAKRRFLSLTRCSFLSFSLSRAREPTACCKAAGQLVDSACIYIYINATPPPKPMFLSAGVQLVSIFVHLTMYYKNVQIHKVMCLLNSSWTE